MTDRAVKPTNIAAIGRACWKGACGLVLLVLYLFLGTLFRAVPLGKTRKRALVLRLVSLFSRMLLALLGFRVIAHHRKRLMSGTKGRLIIANHVSYVDILVIASLAPAVFITSIELRNTALLGILASLGGSIFVERRNPAGLKQEIEIISRVLSEGFSVVLFPEGTTSDGDGVRSFKNSFFDAAIKADCEIFPLCLRYRKINNAPITARSRDSLFYYGGMTFFPHSLGLLALRSIDVEVFLLEAIAPRNHASRKQLSALAHTMIGAAYGCKQ